MRVYDIFTGEVKDAKFATAYTPDVDVVIAPMSKESITETAYVPPEVQIKDMIAAGVRLDAERRARFAAVNGGEEISDEELEPDITQMPGVDLVDVANAAKAVAGRLADQQAAAVKAAQEAAVAAAKEAEDARIKAAVEAALAAQQTSKGS